VPNSWTSPTVVQIGQAHQLLTSGSPWVIAYDPRSGQELYRADCLSGDVAPTQILADGKIIAIEPYNNIVALRTDGANGDITQTHLAWRTAANIPDISSPVSDNQLIWTVTTDGTLTAFDAADGAVVYTQLLDAEVQSSPCLVGDVLYILTVRGTMILAKTGRQYEEIKRLELGEKCYASPAFAPGRLVIRTEKNLYCIGAAP
jgi:outer membrane protein assembly factor BamB